MVFFFLISIFISIIINKKIFLQDKYNQFLLICSGIILFSSINSILYLSPITQQNKYFVVLGLANWIPFFILFASSQIYLKTSEQRRIFSKVIISGTIPVIISCFLQFQLNIYGPFEIFNGLIVWFQKPISVNAGVTGLFNNQNYTGIWLSSVLPFSINELNYLKSNNIKKYIVLLMNFLIVYYLLLTNSRNAFLGLIFVLLTQLRAKYFLIISGFLSTLFFLINSVKINIISNFITNNNFLPTKIFNKIFELDNGLFETERFDIYRSTLKLINEQPFLGWGSSTFADVYKIRNVDWIVSYQHSHSMILDIAYNFGIPFAILMVFFVTKLATSVFIKLYKNPNKIKNSDVNKYWLISTLVIVISHLFDITYYDGKISILIWILFAGLKCIIEEKILKIFLLINLRSNFQKNNFLDLVKNELSFYKFL